MLLRTMMSSSSWSRSPTLDCSTKQINCISYKAKIISKSFTIHKLSIHLLFKSNQQICIMFCITNLNCTFITNASNNKTNRKPTFSFFFFIYLIYCSENFASTCRLTNCSKNQFTTVSFSLCTFKCVQNT